MAEISKAFLEKVTFCGFQLQAMMGEAVEYGVQLGEMVFRCLGIHDYIIEVYQGESQVQLT